jgi:hypothetical protein
LVIGFTLGYLVDHAREIGNDNHGPRIELVDYSVNRTDWGRTFRVKVSNLGDEIGNSTIRCWVNASIIVQTPEGNVTEFHQFDASDEVRLAPSETVTVTLNVYFADHPPYFTDYRYQDGIDYFRFRPAHLNLVVELMWGYE